MLIIVGLFVVYLSGIVIYMRIIKSVFIMYVIMW